MKILTAANAYAETLWRNLSQGAKDSAREVVAKIEGEIDNGYGSVFIHTITLDDLDDAEKEAILYFQRLGFGVKSEAGGTEFSWEP